MHTEAATFPATVGWHPWFRRRIEVGGSLEVDLDAKRWYPRGVDGLPLGFVEPPAGPGPVGRLLHRRDVARRGSPGRAPSR